MAAAAARKFVFTDRGLKALKPAPPGKRYMAWDAMQPHLCVRVTEKGAKSFVVVKRKAGAQLTFHVVGQYPAIKLKDAREAATDALRTLSEGKSPKEAKAEEEREVARRRADTFAMAVERFVEQKKADGRRTWREMDAVLRREFLGQEPMRTKKVTKRADGQATEWVTEWANGKHPIWRDRPIVEITRRAVIERLDQIKSRGGKHAARHAMSIVRSLFNWAAEGERFGLVESPADLVRDKTIGITAKDRERARVLDDSELRDVWQAAEALAYPFGRVVQLLMLTGQRLNDIARAQRKEVDLEKGELTVPRERYKTNVEQVVPLTKKAVEILNSLPKFERGFLFTTTGGVRPVGAHSKMKAKLDKAIATSRKHAKMEPMTHWVLHDLRRTVRTRLVSDLGVDAFIAERVLGHALSGLHRVYDKGTHSEQKREALEKWEALLLSIVEPPPAKQTSTAKQSNVVPMRKTKR
jgi:integrase